MFAALSLRSTNKSLQALIVHDVDPGSPGSFPQSDALPDVVRLARDVQSYRQTKSHPLVSFVGPCSAANPPAVLTGGLQFDGKCFNVLTTVGVWAIDFIPFTEANSDLLKRSREPGTPTMGPVLTPLSGTSQIKWIPLEMNRRLHIQRHACLSWMAGLALRHCITTHLLVRLMRGEESAGGFRSLNETQSSPRNYVWVWYPSAKPRSLRSWMAFLWKDKLSIAQLKYLSDRLYPSFAGFYKAAVLSSPREGVCKLSLCQKPINVIDAKCWKTMMGSGLEMISKYARRMISISSSMTGVSANGRPSLRYSFWEVGSAP